MPERLMGLSGEGEPGALLSYIGTPGEEPRYKQPTNGMMIQGQHSTTQHAK